MIGSLPAFARSKRRRSLIGKRRYFPIFSVRMEAKDRITSVRSSVARTPLELTVQRMWRPSLSLNLLPRLDMRRVLLLTLPPAQAFSPVGR